MNKKLVKECIKRINIHAFKVKIRYYLTGNTEYVFRYRNINASFYRGTYNILERYYRMKGYRCDAVMDKTDDWGDNHFIISAIRSGKSSFFNEC